MKIKKQKFKIKLIALNEKLRKKRDLEMEIANLKKDILSEASLTNQDRNLISIPIDYYSGDIRSEIKQVYKNCNRELPEILRDL
ncbi:hypothetical protein [Peptostreptococcus stomatis]|uniref:hypothetical protein n=1 Tax=Peptostreptococcus stomatis TaxID=341694 RepID=UPI0026ECC951|nr:hypothetical protein [Peptostreptococcus stomatis]